MKPDDPAYRGQADYTPGFLRIYDPFVLGFMARVVWRWPTPPLVESYRRHLGRRHLDVGPGTGYFLDKAGLPPDAEMTLLDPNPNVLARASHRLARVNPTIVEADVLKPLPVSGPFDSAALSGVLHCLPGPQSRKAAAVRNIARVLTPDGVLFGVAVLGSSARHTLPARASLWALNRRGVFDNLADTEEGLREILEESFQAVEIKVISSMVEFTASHPRQR
ncbi:MAG: class I SAM-dependent methyltransferase [Actinomycetota bacterium]